MAYNASVIEGGKKAFFPPSQRGKRLVRVTYDEEDGVAVVTMDDPSHFNAMSREMGDDMQTVAERLRRMKVGRIVLQGNGPHFCVGGNPYSSMGTSLSSIAYASRFALTGVASLRSVSPMWAAVHGKVVGGGMALMLAADCRVADEECVFEHGNLVRGVCPLGMFSRTLPHEVGEKSAWRMYLLNETLSSSVAVRIGLVHRSSPVPKEEAYKWACEETPISTRLPFDDSHMDAEAVAHARCRMALKGGTYATAKGKYADAVPTPDDRVLVFGGGDLLPSTRVVVLLRDDSVPASTVAEWKRSVVVIGTREDCHLRVVPASIGSTHWADEVVPDADVEATAMRLAAWICSHPEQGLVEMLRLAQV